LPQTEFAQAGCSRQYLTIISFIAIFLFGISLTFLPASLVAMSDEMGTNLGRLGILIVLRAGGFLTAVFFSGMLFDAIGQRVLLIGVFVVSLGLLMFACLRLLSWLAFAAFIFGAGGGIIEGTSSAFLADLYPEKRGSILNLSQVFFGIGALVGPWFIGIPLSMGYSWRSGFTCAGILAFLLGLSMIPAPFQKRRATGGAGSVQHGRKLWAHPCFLLLVAAMFTYVAAEQGLAAWISAYMETDLRSPPLLANLSLSLFWGVMIVGRALTSWLSNVTTYTKILLYSALAAAVFNLGVVITINPVIVLVMVALTGLFFSGIWPTILAEAATVFAGQTGTVFSLLITAGGIGSMVYPGVVGAIAETTGLRTGLLTTGLLSLLLVVIFGALARQGLAPQAGGTGSNEHCC